MAKLGDTWEEHVDWRALQPELKRSSLDCLLSTHSELQPCGWRGLHRLLEELHKAEDPVLGEILQARGAGLRRDVKPMWDTLEVAICRAAASVLAQFPSFEALAPLVFRNELWVSLVEPVMLWARHVAQRLLGAHEAAIHDIDPVQGWRIRTRPEDSNAEVADFLENLKVTGGHPGDLSLIGQLLYYPMRKAVQLHVEEFIDPDHLFTVGASLLNFSL